MSLFTCAEMIGKGNRLVYDKVTKFMKYTGKIWTSHASILHHHITVPSVAAQINHIFI